MLPAATRLTRRDDFATAVQRGRRAARGSVVVHLACVDAVSSAGPPAGPKVGFVVGRAVGGSVVRHRVQRRLRHLMRRRLADLPGGALVVVRALPASAHASSAALGADLDRALRRLRETCSQSRAIAIDSPAGSSRATSSPAATSTGSSP